ncbi:hypothetical protein B224_1112 [Aeromonas media WS]|nr:hypothetical protein B224_1112 [Aeromonas media WS]
MDQGCRHGYSSDGVNKMGSSPAGGSAWTVLRDAGMGRPLTGQTGLCPFQHIVHTR